MTGATVNQLVDDFDFDFPPATTTALEILAKWQHSHHFKPILEPSRQYWIASAFRGAWEDPEPTAEDRFQFQSLMQQWRTERDGFQSSLAEIIACPSYLRIIGCGPKMVPLIIEQLELEGDNPDHWCAALEAITGETPVPEEDRGDTVRIAQAWISWKKSKSAHQNNSLAFLLTQHKSPVHLPGGITASLGLLESQRSGGGRQVPQRQGVVFGHLASRKR